MNILNGFIFSQYKLHHRSLTGLFMGLWKYWGFQSDAKVEQIIAIVSTHSVSCYKFKDKLSSDTILKYNDNFLDSTCLLSDRRLSAIIDASMFCLICLTDEAGRKTFQVNEWVGLCFRCFAGFLSVYLHVLAS